MNNSTIPILADIPHRSFYRQTLLPVGCLSLLYVLSIWIFAKCKRMIKTIRWWFLHILSSNMVSFLFFIISQFILAEQDLKFLIWYMIFDKIARAGLLAGILGTFALGCERLFSLIYAMNYQLYTTNCRLLICVLIINTVSLIASSTVWIDGIQLKTEMNLLNTSEIAAWAINSLILVFTLLTIVVYSLVGVWALRKERSTPGRQNDYSRFIKSTVKCFVLVLEYIILVLPPTICDFVCLVLEECPELILNWKKTIGILRFTFYCSLPFVLVASCYESRYLILMKLCFFHKKYRDQMETKYKQKYATYDIATTCN